MIKILIKNRLRSLFGTMVNKSRDGSAVKGGQGRIALVILLYIFLIGSFAFMSTTMAIALGSVLIPIGAEWLYFAVFIIATLSVIFILSIFETKSELFECKDNDLLLSMPIKPRDIVASRVSVVLIYNYLEELVIMLPCIIVYGVLSHDPVGVLGALIVSIFIPLLATALASVCGYGVAMISKLFKKKTAISVILYLLFFGAYMLGYEALIEGFDSFIADTESSGTVANIPFLYYIGAAALFEPLSITLTVLISLTAAFVCYFFVSKSYIKIVTSNYTPHATYKDRTHRTHSPLFSLVQKEISHFFSSAIYILNGGIGYIFMVAIGVFLVVKSNELTAVAEELFRDVSEPVAVLLPILVCAVIFMSSFGVISAATLSLEGKRLWIIKTMPIDSRTLLLSKALPQLVISFLPTLITSLLLIIACKAGIEYWLFIIIIPQLANAFFALFGTVINTAFPKFEFQNEAEVIKQSLSSFIVMMSNMLISLILIGLTFLLCITVHSLVAFSLLLVLFLLLSVAMYFVLTRISTKRYDKFDV